MQYSEEGQLQQHDGCEAQRAHPAPLRDRAVDLTLTLRGTGAWSTRAPAFKLTFISTLCELHRSSHWRQSKNKTSPRSGHRRVTSQLRSPHSWKGGRGVDGTLELTTQGCGKCWLACTCSGVIVPRWRLETFYPTSVKGSTPRGSTVKKNMLNGVSYCATCP